MTVPAAEPNDNESPQPKACFVSVSGTDILNSAEETKALDYQPTRYELLQLVRHWSQVLIDEIWCMESPVGYDRFRMQRASDRLNDLEKVLGDEVQKLYDEEVEYAGRKHDWEEWHICFYGTDEEKKAWGTHEPPAPGEPIFAVPAGCEGEARCWEGQHCNLHNRLTGEMMRLNRVEAALDGTEAYDFFWLKYGPWECPDCHTKVRWALSRVNDADCDFDPEQTAKLLAEVCPPRTQRPGGAA